MNNNLENNVTSNNNDNNTINESLNSQVYQQIENDNKSNNSNIQMDNNLNNNMPDNNNFQETKKKSIVLPIIIVLIIIGVVGYYFYNKSSNINNNDSNNSENVNKNKLVGTWKATEQTSPSKDGSYLIPNIKFVLNDDNTFTRNGEYKLRYTNSGGGSTILENTSGTYELKGNKIKLVYDEKSTFSFYKDFTEFEINKDELIIGSIKYNKVSGSNVGNNTTATSNNEIVGKWYRFIDNTKDESIYYIFKADGTGSYTVNGIPLDLKYEIKGNSLFINTSGVNNAKENSYSISNNILSIDDGVGTNTFIKG